MENAKARTMKNNMHGSQESITRSAEVNLDVVNGRNTTRVFRALEHQDARGAAGRAPARKHHLPRSNLPSTNCDTNTRKRGRPKRTRHEHAYRISIRKRIRNAYTKHEYNTEFEYEQSKCFLGGILFSAQQTSRAEFEYALENSTRAE